MIDVQLENITVINQDTQAVVQIDEQFVSVLDISQPEIVHIRAAGPQGIPGSAAEFTNGSAQVEFQWNNVTTLPISIITGNKLVLRCSVFITTPFDGVGATLQLGDVGDVGRLVHIAENDPSAIAEYAVSPQVTYGADTQVNLTINPGAGGTQGEGLIVIQVQA